MTNKRNNKYQYVFDKDTGKIYFEEFNPLPGSLSFYLWEKSDPELLYTNELTEIINRAFEIHALKNELDKNLGFKAL